MHEPEIHLSTRPGPQADALTETRETPFCIAVLGDFGGHGLARATGRDGSSAPDWRPRRATPDTVMKLAGLRPSIPGGPGEDGRLDSLDAFHPDRLFERSPAFETLRDARTAILEGRDPGIDLGVGAPEGDVAEEESGGPEASREADPAPADAVPSGGLLDAIVADAEPAKPPPGAVRPFASGDELEAFVRDAVRKHTVREAPDRSADLALVDARISERMRQVLHEPGVRSLEALWRGLAFLLSKVDTTGKVRVYLVDVPREDLERDVLDADDLSRTRLVELLLGLGADAIPFPWALAVGAYAFDDDRRDMELLAGIAAVCGVAGIPWVSEGTGRLAGAPSPEELPNESDASPAVWRAVRSMSGTDHVALACPPFALRPPWGTGGGRTRRFDFQEGDAGDPAAPPWGNPAFACAALLARPLARTGRAGAPTDDLDLEIDAAVPGPDDRPRLTRARVDPTASARLSTAGLTPLIEFPLEARIRIPGVRPIAASGDSPLRAWWNDSTAG